MARGIQEDRKCRDVIFLIAFIVFWFGMITVMGIAYHGGDPRVLYYPDDSFNHTCGLGKFSKKTQVYYPGVVLGDFLTAVCLKECPTIGAFDDPLWCIHINPYQEIKRENVVCVYDVDNTTAVNSYMISGNPIATSSDCWCAYDANPLLRRCLPAVIFSDNSTSASSGVSNATAIQKAAAGSKLAQVFSDLLNTWQIIFGFGFVDIALCFCWLILITIACRFIVWLTVFGFLILMIAITSWLWDWRATFPPATQTAGQQPQSSFNVRNCVSVLAYTWTALTILAIIMVIALRKRIELAVQILRVASSAVRTMPMIVFFPILSFGVMILFLVYWFTVALYLASFNTNSQRNQYNSHDLHTMRLYWLLAFFWNLNFLIALNQTVVAGSIASWYWTKDKSTLSHVPVEKAFFRILHYHLGSLALGSLILAIVETIHSIVYEIQQQLERTNRANQVVKCLFCVLDCCFNCVERFLKFLNRNAYIMIAIYGGSFCSSAKKAFELILANVLRVAVVSMVAEYIIFLAKLTITLMAGILSAHVIRERSDVFFWFFPVFFIMVFAYFIATGFFVVYHMAVDTILLCFLDECDEIKGKDVPDSDLYMTPGLRKFITDTHNAHEKEKQQAQGIQQPAST